MNLYTKYEVSILNGCGDIFDEKVLRNYGRTDGRTNGTTDRCKPVYPPPHFFKARVACIPNLKFLSYTVVEISLTKTLERKKKEEKNKYENARLQSHDSTGRCEPQYQI